MTDLEKQIELLEQQGNDAELLSLLAYHPDTRARNRVAADKFRLLAVELRYQAIAVAAKALSLAGLFHFNQLDPLSGGLDNMEGGLASAERPQREADLKAQLLDLERHEEIDRAGLKKGIECHRRPDSQSVGDPWLGIRDRGACGRSGMIWSGDRRRLSHRTRRSYAHTRHLAVAVVSILSQAVRRWRAN